MFAMAKYHIYESYPNRYFSARELRTVFTEHEFFIVFSEHEFLIVFSEHELHELNE